MRAIWKFPLEIKDEQIVKMPLNSYILCVQEQPENGLCLWAIVDTSEKRIGCNICIYGTGHKLPDERIERDYIGTVQMKDGYVWHVFKHGYAVMVGR